MPDEFIRAGDAFQAVAALYEWQEHEQAQEALLRRLASGALRAKALGSFKYLTYEAVDWRGDEINYQWQSVDCDDDFIPKGFWH